MKNTETWKPIFYYDNYEVSNTGKVRNKKTGRILKSTTSNSGYTMVCLSRRGKIKSISVHRLVMETFKPVQNMDELQVNHIDWDKTNNNLENLEWVTRQENLLHGAGPTELRTLETMLCNAIRKAVHDWYDRLLTTKCTKSMFTEKVIEKAMEEAIEFYNDTHDDEYNNNTIDL